MKKLDIMGLSGMVVFKKQCWRRMMRRYFHSGDAELYGNFYLPKAACSRGVVLCEPFGEEKRCCARLLTRLAERLCSRGIAVLRFDLRGTGDSGGVQAETLWSQWEEDTLTAGRELMQEASLESVEYMGFRSGGLLAMAAACQFVSAAGVYLIEPMIDGNELMKMLELKQAIWQSQGTSGSTREFGGFPMCQKMEAELRKRSLENMLVTLSDSVKLYLLHVTGGQRFPVSWSHLQERAQKNGTALLLRDKPFWGQVEYFESDVVINALLAMMQ